jgi:hypothetical protein
MSRRGLIARPCSEIGSPAAQSATNRNHIYRRPF